MILAPPLKTRAPKSRRVTLLMRKKPSVNLENKENESKEKPISVDTKEDPAEDFMNEEESDSSSDNEDVEKDVSKEIPANQSAGSDASSSEDAEGEKPVIQRIATESTETTAKEFMDIDQDDDEDSSGSV